MVVGDFVKSEEADMDGIYMRYGIVVACGHKQASVLWNATGGPFVTRYKRGRDMASKVQQMGSSCMPLSEYRAVRELYDNYMRGRRR